jgi:hypothetical protein
MLRRRHEAGERVTARASTTLWRRAKQHFGSWVAALQAAGVPPPKRGRPPHRAPVTPERRRLRIHCAICDTSQDDLEHHVGLAHHLTRTAYEIQHGPIPPPRWSFAAVLEALRQHLQRGGKPNAKSLTKRDPSLLRAVRRMFQTVEEAFDVATSLGGALQASTGSRKG